MRMSAILEQIFMGITLIIQLSASGYLWMSAILGLSTSRYTRQCHSFSRSQPVDIHENVFRKMSFNCILSACRYSSHIIGFNLHKKGVQIWALNLHMLRRISAMQHFQHSCSTVMLSRYFKSVGTVKTQGLDRASSRMCILWEKVHDYNY